MNKIPLTKLGPLLLVGLCVATVVVFFGFHFMERAPDVSALPLSLRLSIPYGVSLNRTTILLVDLRSRLELLNVTSWIVIPQEIVADGNLSWRGKLSANSPMLWSVNITCVRNGYWEIRGHVLAATDTGTLGDLDVLYLRVCFDQGEVSSIPFEKNASSELWRDSNSTSTRGPPVLRACNASDISNGPGRSPPSGEGFGFSCLCSSCEHDLAYLRFECCSAGRRSR